MAKLIVRQRKRGQSIHVWLSGRALDIHLTSYHDHQRHILADMLDDMDLEVKLELPDEYHR